MSLFYRIRGQLISKYPESDGIGGWKIVMHYDCDPSNGGPPYVNVWEHLDGRQSQEGPGFCDDPDLEFLLFQQQREEQKRRKTRDIWHRLMYWPWLIVIIQGVISFPTNGFWIVLSFIGSFLLFAVVPFVCESYPFLQNRKYFFRSLLAVFVSLLLIEAGKFNSLSIGLFDMPLYCFASFLGLSNFYINRY